jgi:uncharacterized protein YhaN
MDGTGPLPEAEELDALRAQLTEARTESAVLRQELEQVASARADADTAREELDAAHDRMRAAAGRYRELVVSAEPELPAELIAGDDIEAVAASAEAARQMVARVRTHIESQVQNGRVPAGAPPRRGIDLAALSPEQKIAYGLAQRAAS